MLMTTKIRSYLTTSPMTLVLLAPTACSPPDNEPSADDLQADLDSTKADVLGPRGEHQWLLAQPAAVSLPKDLNRMPVIYDENGELRVAESPPTSLKSDPAGPETNLNGSTRNIYVVGGSDFVTYYFLELTLPSYVTDADGGTIRLIMQHESEVYDQVRVIDEHIGTEYVNNAYGARGRYIGRYGWTRQSGGGDYAWVLGDPVAHNLATPWDWAWIVDYRWLQGNTVLGGDVIRIYAHPHVTARVIFID